MTEPGKRFLAGDPLRGLAALGVLVLHASSAALSSTGYVQLLAPASRFEAYGDVVGSVQLAGFFGVWVFFVLSGYLIGRPFVRAVIYDSPRPSLTAFARNRALRILPPYWVVLTLVLVFAVLLTGKATVSVGQVAGLYALLLPDGNPIAAWTAHMWTLEVEAKFYIAMPIAALAAGPVLRRLQSAEARALAIAVVGLAWTCAAPFVIDNLLGNSFLVLIRLFVAGIVLAALEPLIQPRVAERNAWKWAATALFAVASAYVLAFPWLRISPGAPLDGDLSGLALDMALAGVVGGALLRQWVDGRCWGVLDNRATRWLGTRSYSFYLVHYVFVTELALLIAKAGYGYKVTFVLLLSAAFAASAIAAEGLYRAVERPFLARKKPTVTLPSAERAERPALPLAEVS